MVELEKLLEDRIKGLLADLEQPDRHDEFDLGMLQAFLNVQTWLAKRKLETQPALRVIQGDLHG